jgi:NAD(P)-dependent dehydrogenase (short-subunit alcohol dehydrogenase family)
MSTFTVDQVPSQRGRTVVVTGANSGIGFHTARVLAEKGAHVILACRDGKRGADAVARIRAATPDANVETMPLDLSSLASVRTFAREFLARGVPLDLLINNAGVMAPPSRQTTADGFELQIGTNHLGHFLLTSLLFPAIAKAAGARVVNVASLAHKSGRIHFEDLQSEKSYGGFTAYAQSKLANLLFTLELQKRATAAGLDLLAVAAHPGFSATNLQATGPTMGKPTLVSRLFTSRLVSWLTPYLSQTDAEGALPTLLAATGSVAPNGYYGPTRMFETIGSPAIAKKTKRARDEAVAAELWRRSEDAVGAKFVVTAAAAKKGWESVAQA